MEVSVRDEKRSFLLYPPDGDGPFPVVVAYHGSDGPRKVASFFEEIDEQSAMR